MIVHVYSMNILYVNFVKTLSLYEIIQSYTHMYWLVFM